jgi:hypothetical protein
MSEENSFGIDMAQVPSELVPYTPDEQAYMSQFNGAQNIELACQALALLWPGARAVLNNQYWKAEYGNIVLKQLVNLSIRWRANPMNGEIWCLPSKNGPNFMAGYKLWDKRFWEQFNSADFQISYEIIEDPERKVTLGASQRDVLVHCVLKRKDHGGYMDNLERAIEIVKLAGVTGVEVLTEARKMVEDPSSVYDGWGCVNPGTDQSKIYDPRQHAQDLARKNAYRTLGVDVTQAPPDAAYREDYKLRLTATVEQQAIIEHRELTTGEQQQIHEHAREVAERLAPKGSAGSEKEPAYRVRQEIADYVEQNRYTLAGSVSKKQRGMVAGKLTELVGEAARVELLEWLSGQTSTADLTKAQASGIIEWAMTERAKEEAAECLRAFALQRGQVDVFTGEITEGEIVEDEKNGKGEPVDILTEDIEDARVEMEAAPTLPEAVASALGITIDEAVDKLAELEDAGLGLTTAKEIVKYLRVAGDEPSTLDKHFPRDEHGQPVMFKEESQDMSYFED